MKKHYFLATSLFVFGGLIAIAPSASAVGVEVPFVGTVISSCIAVPTPGVLALGGDYKTLSSTNTGGVSGLVAVTCTTSSTLSAAAPVDGIFVGGTTAFNGTRSSTSSSSSLSAGVNTVNINMTASTTEAAVKAGAYNFTVPVTVTPN
jgi:hypothetical protein